MIFILSYTNDERNLFFFEDSTNTINIIEIFIGFSYKYPFYQQMQWFSNSSLVCQRENSSSMSSEKYQIQENKTDADVEKSQNEKNESEKKQLLSEEFLLDLQMIVAIVFILMLTGVILFVKVLLKIKLL